MKIKLVLVQLFLGLCFSTFAQQNQAPKSENKANVAEKGLIKVSVLYPYAEGKTFDMDYYEKSHMPYVAGLLGSNLVRYTIEKGISSGIPNSPLPFMAIGSFYVKSLSDYQAAITPNREAIRADFPKYTNISPTILVSEVVK
ncbi:EthD family reductase [Spirosoma sp. BT702]|uniref:EthD family reductase n=1 Tax=Spirosoma profusum TaxID=2771354 RepID=A0A926XWA6_9BACT|nr:EthD family reductase [Spirosoma profusum]MBD2701694.1 EthD family reductase [Spirosoma profusum]